MIFSEPKFLLFFLLVFGVYWALPSNQLRKWFLLAGSLYFYGSWDPRFLVLIVLCATVDFVASLKIEAARAQGRSATRWLMLSLVYDLGTLGFFKYFDFFAGSFVSLLQGFGFEVEDWVPKILLPVGISFFTFQAMSYTIDVYRGQLKASRSYTDFLLFVTFFPQLVAGPIVRASDFLPQLDEKRWFKNVDVHLALGQFLSGFVKKAVIADLIAGPADAVFGDPTVKFGDPKYVDPAEFTAGSIWIAVFCYSIQIYCDFSGYSDMAIGTARLLGYELCQNFRFPYLATSITDFWRRWHLSLSTWLRDYLYISLGGNRGGRWFTHRNLMLTMLLGGLWHGAGWNFVIWGAIHGIALVVHKEWVRHVGEGKLPIVSRLLTLYVVMAAWIFFRAPSFEQAWPMLKAWLWFESSGTKEVAIWSPVVSWTLPVRCVVLLTPLLLCHLAVSRNVHLKLRAVLPPLLVTLLFGVIAELALAFMPLQARPFIYFQF
ncbi:MAG: MBOAT family O-acyltransferase [Planctomycetota bacterium]